MGKLYVGIFVVVLIVLIICMSMFSTTVSKYAKIDRDTEKLACENTFYDSINNRRCCVSDTNAGSSECVSNWITP